MKYLKTYENSQNSLNYPSELHPEMGDYVILSWDASIGTSIPKYSSQNIGRITKEPLNDILVWIEYDNDLQPLKYIHKSYIEHISKNKKDLETILLANKYNL